MVVPEQLVGVYSREEIQKKEYDELEKKCKQLRVEKDQLKEQIEQFKEQFKEQAERLEEQKLKEVQELSQHGPKPKRPKDK